MIKYILFDVAGTLLYKPTLFDKINEILISNEINVSPAEIILKHKLLSEVIHFPDRTDNKFYYHFNSELLRLLGVIPNDKLLNDIFNNCTYLPWEKFSDTNALSELTIPIGIISNFNNTLREKLTSFFGNIFKDILVSEELGVAKPKIEFYQKAIESIGISPKNILYVGDSLKLDVEPANKLGIKSLLIDREGFYKNSNYRIQSLNEIKNFIK